jgi:MoaA/NifB/PqqE/SkfB family radical SAM enzyme
VAKGNIILTFDYNNINEYQIEITSLCNAACPQCPRNDLGKGINSYMPLTSISREVLDKVFPAELVHRLRQIFFCGSYGDPIAHTDFLDILRDFRRKSPTVWLYIHTNGGIRNPDWWAELAQILNGYGKIDFGIDGLADTNHIYRKNVNWNKLMSNVQSFIRAGGKAQWNYIVFEHNEHQVEEACQMSVDMGFESFLPRATGRFFNHSDVTEMTEWPVHDALPIKPPKQVVYRNRSMLKLVELKQEYNNVQEYFDTTDIRCDALLGNKVIISAEGLVLPCNFFTHNLYDARFRDNSLPGANKLSFVDGKNQIQSIIEHYGKDNLNIHYKTLEEIFANPFWQHVVDSWNKSLSEGRIFECAMTCGTKLTKVWDQTK